MTEPKHDDAPPASDGPNDEPTEESIDLGEGPKDTVKMTLDEIDQAIKDREAEDAAKTAADDT